MAPVGTELVRWVVWDQPLAALTSAVLLFILCIALLIICATCKKHSFKLESKESEQKPSTLISVAKVGEEPGAKDNPAADDIRSDEAGHVDLALDEAVYRPWRSHTLTTDSRQQNQANGRLEAN